MRGAWAGLLLVLCSGCASYTFNASALQEELGRGEYEAALERLDPLGEDDVAALLDRAVCLQALGRLDESDAAFEAAIRITDDLYTKSVSQEALSLLTSDLARDYRAAAFEQAYVAYFRSWNYLTRGSVEGVLVEARRIEERLTFISNSCSDAGGACGHDPFLRYWSGLLFEWGGETNDAYVAYKQADLAAATARERHGVEPPADLGRRLVRLARGLGFRDEAETYAASYGVDVDGLDDRMGSAVFVLENGLVGRREETALFLPILKSDDKTAMALDTDGWSHTLADRAHVSYESVEVDYLLKVALPVFVTSPPAAVGARFELGEHAAPTRLVSPISLRSQQALDDAMAGILARSAARALTKYLLKEAAESELGEEAGWLANILAIATERADTRSWRSLPHEIQLAEIEVPAGTYAGAVVVTGPENASLANLSFPEVRVPERGGIAFVRHRAVP